MLITLIHNMCSDFMILKSLRHFPGANKLISSLCWNENFRTLWYLAPIDLVWNFTDNIFNGIFYKANFCILIQISLNFVATGPVDNKSVMVQITVWCWQHYLNECWPNLLTQGYAGLNQDKDCWDDKWSDETDLDTGISLFVRTMKIK